MSIVHASLFQDPAGYCLASLTAGAVYVDSYTSMPEDRNGCQEKDRKPRRAWEGTHVGAGAGWSQGSCPVAGLASIKALAPFDQCLPRLGGGH